MNGKEIALGIFLLLFLASMTSLLLGDEEITEEGNALLTSSGDPLFQYEGHDHSNASQHIAGTDNMELLDYNSLFRPRETPKSR